MPESRPLFLRASMKRKVELAALLVVAGLTVAACGRDADEANAPPRAATAMSTLTAADIAENNRGVALMGYFDYPGAREAFAGLVERRPGWLDAQVNLAIATLNRQQEGDEARALAIVGDVLETDPDHLRAHYVSGLLNLYLGETALAETHFTRVVESRSQDAYARYYLGQVLMQAGRLDEAVTHFRAAMALDPYLRSAYYGAALALRRTGQTAEAQQLLQEYQRFENNPRARLAEFKYTRMGPLGEALATGEPTRARAATRPGPAFGETMEIGQLDAPDARSTLTTVDIDRDGDQDLFATRIGAEGHNQLLVQVEARGWEPVAHALNDVTAVNAVGWGDFDNDGLVDVYLCRDGANQLWRQSAKAQWRDDTGATGTGNASADCADVLVIDADHDGDLDIFVVNRDAPNELYSNNLDGTFRALAGDYGIGGRPGSRNAIATDIDNDRDLDLIVIKDTPPHEVFLNDRLWQYRALSSGPDWLGRRIEAAVAADVDADGFNDLVALMSGRTMAWSSATEAWVLLGSVETPGATQLMVGDVDGNGVSDLLARDGALVLARNPWMRDAPVAARTADGELTREPPVFEPQATTAVAQERYAPGTALVAALPVYIDAQSGPALVALDAAGALTMLPSGEGRQNFVVMDLSGKEESSESMRSNRDGIGTRVALRVGSDWSIVERVDNNSAAGQSLQPVMIGIGTADKADFVALTWSDGVLQTELELRPGELHRIEETQRQLSSCPVLFAWNGEGYGFVTDMLGVGGVGFFVEPGVAATPRPWEYLLLPPGALVPRDGDYVLKITEPMEEIAYLDSARLHVYDLPPGLDLVIDDRMVIAGPAATGQAIFYREEIMPLQAYNARGDDVTREVLARDGRAAPVGELDARFIGRLARPHTITLDFEKPLDAAWSRAQALQSEGRGRSVDPGQQAGTEAGDAVLIIDGWVEYPYSQTVFAAWQAGAAYTAPTLEAFGADGRWHPVYRQFGYPAGMPRRMALPLRDLPRGTMRLRLTTNLEVYYDRISVAFALEHAPAHTVVEPVAARQRLLGFPLRTTGAQRLPGYDYDKRAPFWDTRYPRGNYSAFGNVTELVTRTDDAVAVIGPGEEVELRFPALLRALPEGWQRRYVLEVRGWAKDMDLYTYDGGTVGPLPTREGETDTRVRDALHQRYHTRFQSGF